MQLTKEIQSKVKLIQPKRTKLKKERITIKTKLTLFQELHSKINHKFARGIRETIPTPNYIRNLYVESISCDQFRCSICNQVFMLEVTFWDHKEKFRGDLS